MKFRYETRLLQTETMKFIVNPNSSVDEWLYTVQHGSSENSLPEFAIVCYGNGNIAFIDESVTVRYERPINHNDYAEKKRIGLNWDTFTYALEIKNTLYLWNPITSVLKEYDLTAVPEYCREEYMWFPHTQINKLISEEIPARVAADQAYQNAIKNSDRQNAKIEHDEALRRVMTSLVADHTELFKQFSDNSSFQKWLTDTIFTMTYDKDVNISEHRPSQ